jgi:transposase
MDKSEQRILIEYFLMKDLDNRLIHNELKSVLHDSASSLSIMERWVSRFKTGVATCEDNLRSGRPSSHLGSSLAAFLLEFPFTNTHQMSRNFHTSHYTIKEIVSRQLGLRKFSRCWVPYKLSDDQKATKARDSKVLLAILFSLRDNSFEGIYTEDES